jgi:superoxide dismutase, Fe-Mn family
LLAARLGPPLQGGQPLWDKIFLITYYLKYQNRRADYIKAWWSVVNWSAINQRLAVARETAGAAR